MASTIEKQLQEVEQLIYHGQYKKALKLIDDVLKKKDITKKFKLLFMVHKNEIYCDLGKHEEALALADEIIENSKGYEESLIFVDTLIHKARAIYFSKAEAVTALNLIEKGFKLLNEIPEITPKELAKRKSILLLWKGGYTFPSGDFDKAVGFIEESIPFAEESGDKRVLSRCLTVFGYFAWDDKKKRKEAFEKAYKIIIEIDNKMELALYYMFIAPFEQSKREYDKAFESYEKCYALLDEIGSTLYYAESHNNLALAYKSTFQLDKAIESFKISLSSGIWSYGTALGNLAHTYFIKYDLKNAQKYFLKALKLSEEQSTLYSLPGVLYNLIVISIELQENSQARQYLEQLKQISEEAGIERISQYYLFSYILVLKARGKISDLGEAAKLLEDLLSAENLPKVWRFNALYTLLEIRIKELQISTNEAALEQAMKQAIRLEVEAEEQKHLWLLANVYRLQSQIALVELDAEKAIKLLDKANTIATESKNENIKQKIREDQVKIDKQLDMLQKLQEKKAPISEAVKLASLDKTVQSIKEETVLEERDKETGQIIEYRKLFALKI